ncbi:pyridoxal 5'-phosphate synthase [Streptomyces sp. NBC_01216]|uniref:pyridoxine/pyridoxamine 5'-phosphate oxidase n=1 Tax=unclassified Streptomyces TaxID=2593676 RepID=UPI002E165796|nr:pyridoxal 5'-phosphate synthase [Streptomyces sp. NBC_01216]
MNDSRFHEALRSSRVWDTVLPEFRPEDTPPDPLPLFHDWFVAAAAAGEVEPHVMSLATVDEAGRPDVRMLTLHDADARGWHFASHATSAKGRQLAARPVAALAFYWPREGRQVRVRGRVAVGTAEEAREDLRVRSTGALASALVGRQSEVLPSTSVLAEASGAAWERARAEPDAPAETWTCYVLEPAEVEFFQGDERRRHVRLRYRRGRAADSWTRELLWP